MMNKFMLSAVFAIVSNVSYGFALEEARDPVGESAHFVIDKNKARTSSLIKGGTLDTSVAGRIDGDKPAYEVKIDYDFDLGWLGSRQGSEMVKVPEEYYTPEFLQNLRTTGSYEGAYFKVKHLGFADAQDRNGTVYNECDKVLIYDIQKPAFFMMLEQLAEVLNEGFVAPQSLSDIKITAHVKPGVAVMGAVKLDITAKTSGINVMVGADYKP